MDADEKEFMEETEETEPSTSIHGILGEPVAVSDEVLRTCFNQGAFSALAFDLYKETGIVLDVCSHSYVGIAPDQPLSRNQAICAGLLVRITKFMIAVAQVSSAGQRGEIVLALNRSIIESATNLRFLCGKNEEGFYDQFVRYSLAPERELYDLIQRNIRTRNGEVLPIELRMLKSIEKTCRISGVRIEDIDPKFREWGGGMRNRLIFLGEADSYVGIQRIPSHAVHGTWVDLFLHHLEKKEGGFVPDSSWSPVDARLMLPHCILVLDAGRAYLETFLGSLPEVKPLYCRIDDLQERVRRVDEAHEQWFGSQHKSQSD